MKHFPISIIILALLLSACRGSAGGSQVMFVDRREASETRDVHDGDDPLLLLVEIGEDGKLVLNKIDVGTTADLDPICEKLSVIFEDRSRSAIEKREVVIEMRGNVSGEDFEKLIGRMSGIRAAPIHVVKGVRQIGR